MKKIILTVALAAGMSATMQGQGLKDILSGLGGTETLTNLIEGVFTKSDITVADMAGTWQTTGSAVTFKSENFLKKAGGLAAASAVEAKIDPYFKKYGLTGSTIAIAADGTFEMKIKRLSLKGDITRNDDGTFEFAFTTFGSFKLAGMTAYVEKGPDNLNIMFDATKMKNLLSMIAGMTGNKMAGAASSILDSYDGLCVGFKMRQTGAAPAGKGNSTQTAAPAQEESEAESAVSRGAEALKGLLKGRKKH